MIGKFISALSRTKTSFSTSVFHSAGAISLTVTTLNTTCMNSNGSFTVTATGGVTPYQYSENGYPYQTSNYFPGKAPGNYTITVQDANGNSASTTISLTNTFSQPSLNFLTYSPASTCDGLNRSITLIASGGTSP
jgi:uncharacterized membrane protein